MHESEERNLLKQQQLRQQLTILQGLHDKTIQDLATANKLVNQNRNSFLDRSSKRKKEELVDELENFAHEINLLYCEGKRKNRMTKQHTVIVGNAIMNFLSLLLERKWSSILLAQQLLDDCCFDGIFYSTMYHYEEKLLECSRKLIRQKIFNTSHLLQRTIECVINGGLN